MKRPIVFIYIFLLILSACTKNNPGSRAEYSSLLNFSVIDDTREIEFTTTGQIFAPKIVLKDGTSATTTVLWTFDDGATDASLTPSKNYGTAGIRVNKLKVTPWSSLRRINVGYDALDGGSSAIELVDNNYVAAIANLDLVKDSLIELCLSHNPLTSLDLHDFASLETLECYYSLNLDVVNLSNTPNLKRICFEHCSIGATSGKLDISSNTKLEDLRASRNVINNLILPPYAPNWWHFCAGEGNSYSTNPVFNNFPDLKEIWLWDCKLSGNITLTHKGLTWIWISNNSITGLDLSSADFTGGGIIDADHNWLTSFNIYGCSGITEVNVSYNDLTNIDLTGQTGLTLFNASNNALTLGAIKHILSFLDISGVLNGEVDVRVNPAILDSESLDLVTSLTGKGWTVKHD